MAFGVRLRGPGGPTSRWDFWEAVAFVIVLLCSVGAIIWALITS